MITYLRVARLDHWFKNIFMLVGIFAAIGYGNVSITPSLILKSTLAFILVCVVSSVNYIINEIADARYDINHPKKKLRPVASGKVSPRELIFFDAILITFALSISFFTFNEEFFLLMILFLIIGGVFYNMPPIRTKDIPYIDIISESVNNPIRLLLGWS